MREVIPVARARAQQQSDAAVRAAIAEAKERNAATREAIAQALESELAFLEPGEIRDIRKAAAIAFVMRQAEPMTREQQQDWLDEACIGIARYMRTGKIAP